MYKTSQETQKRKDEKKQMILNTATRVFSAKGYHNTTVRDIADAAAVSIGTFYFYFKGKEELFITLYQGIIKEFGDVTLGVVNVECFTLLKNYTRVMIATLWMYEQKQEIAKIMMLEAMTAEPSFQKLESDRIRDFTQVMAGWFRIFKKCDGVFIPDEQVAALIYTSSYYYMINEWLSSDMAVPLTEYGYAFCVYHLQALRIPYDEAQVRAYISEVLEELNQSTNKV